MTPFASLEKSATIQEKDYRRIRDEQALRNRHIALSLKRASQLGLLGAVLGGAKGLKEKTPFGSDPVIDRGIGTDALIGGLKGMLAGGALGAAEGGIKRMLGLDPILDTNLIAHRA